MKKLNIVCSGFFAIAILVSMSGCNKYSESDIEGTWVYTQEYVVRDDYGNPVSVEEEWQFEFKKGGNMTRTLTVGSDEMEAYSVSVEGTYKYEESSGGYEDSKAIGVIEINYDLETIKGHFNSDIYDIYDQDEIMANWRETLKAENEETQKALTKAESYGLLVLNIENNEMTVDARDSKMTFKKK